MSEEQQLLDFKLKPEQEQATLAFISRKDALVALPTGYVKSLCCGLLPCMFDFLRGLETVVITVSSLVALMKEQTAKLFLKGNLCCVHQ